MGRKLAVDLAISHQPLVIALVGELGSGKTTFVQGLAEGLGIENRVISPTFILLRIYNIPGSSNDPGSLEHERRFYHVDLYRLEENLEDEVRNLGLEDVWNKKNNVVVIEWAEKIKKMLPSQTMWVHFAVLGDKERRVTIKNSKRLGY